MNAQKVIETEYRQALDAMYKNNKAYPISSLQGVSIRENDSTGFYAEAYALIKFMIDHYGRDKFRDFIKALNTNDTDGALKQALGVDTNGFENAWRASVGLAAVTPQAGTSTNRGPVIATIEPLGNPASSGGTRSTPVAGNTNSGSSASSKDSGGSSALPIIGVVVAAVVVLGGAGAIMMRRKKA